MGRRRRRRKRRLEGRAGGRDDGPGRSVDVRVDRTGRGKRKKSARVTRRRRSNGNVSEESYDL
jgi:hypothetical protein